MTLSSGMGFHAPFQGVPDTQRGAKMSNTGATLVAITTPKHFRLTEVTIYSLLSSPFGLLFGAIDLLAIAMGTAAFGRI